LKSSRVGAGASLLPVAVVGVVSLLLQRSRELGMRPEDPCSDPSRPPVWRVDLNEAGPGEFEVLPGIGPALARRIVQERERTGRFADADALDRVPGIGPATIERIRPFVR